ncbi:hypothetical protein [Streptomyces sp. V1I1]|uniref:hypothetical protein n=1 Tax=Streptomyces sp. V1I1 TaxID=3042272 RepID=UPI002789D699|nr:hypothetical protein [Streptomyces sp. V1I1]MDQ0945712.1 hypothetical protein [Streptomyces sp. V1I1]
MTKPAPGELLLPAAPFTLSRRPGSPPHARLFARQLMSGALSRTPQPWMGELLDG